MDVLNKKKMKDRTPNSPISKRKRKEVQETGISLDNDIYDGT